MLLLKLVPALAVAIAAVAFASCADEARAEPSGLKGPLDAVPMGADGKPYPLAKHKGDVVLIVNVASKCGLTKQYAALQALHARHQAQGFTVIGIPCNQFMGQEPGSDAEIQQFCSTKYQVTFPVLAKGDVNGPTAIPLYRHLTNESPFTGKIGWNFAKFLVGRDGTVVARFAPTTTPDDPELVAAVAKALAQPRMP